jgi:predicted ester cyclase
MQDRGFYTVEQGRYEILEMIAEADMVACWVRASGTMQGRCSA